jgi:hypothetical protein
VPVLLLMLLPLTFIHFQQLLLHPGSSILTLL